MAYRDDLDNEFEQLIARMEQIRAEAEERLARSGEQPILVLYGIDWTTKRVSVFAVPGADDRR